MFAQVTKQFKRIVLVLNIPGSLDLTFLDKYHFDAIIHNFFPGHLACNNSEDARTISDSILSERTARELYLRSFEYVLQKTNPLSIMAAYNKINGTFAAANSDLLDGICRYEWGYKGWIMTDWHVHETKANCLQGGCDICMPGDYKTYDELCKGGLDRSVAQYRAVNLIRHLSKTKHYFNKELKNK